MRLPIETERLVIRPFHLSTLPEIHKYQSLQEHLESGSIDMELLMDDPEIQRIFEISQEEGFYYTQLIQNSEGTKSPDLPSFDGVCNFVWTMCREMAGEKPSGYGLAVMFKHYDGTMELCGHVRLYDIDYEEKTAKRSAFVANRFQSAGIGKEALMEITKAGFLDLGLETIKITVDPENTKSVNNITNSFNAQHIGKTQVYVVGKEGAQPRDVYGIPADSFLGKTYPDYLAKQAFNRSKHLIEELVADHLNEAEQTVKLHWVFMDDESPFPHAEETTDFNML